MRLGAGLSSPKAGSQAFWDPFLYSLQCKYDGRILIISQLENAFNSLV